MDPALLKRNLFKQIEQFFKRETLRYSPESEAILCCDDEMRNNLISLGDRIRKLPAYKSIKHQDLYLTLIFTFYSMLGEQTEDSFDTKFLKKYSKEPEFSNQLFLDLTTGDIAEADGTNLSQVVRRMLLGLNGGKRRKKTRRTMRKRRKTKTRRKLKY